MYCSAQGSPPYFAPPLPKAQPEVQGSPARLSPGPPKPATAAGRAPPQAAHMSPRQTLESQARRMPPPASSLANQAPELAKHTLNSAAPSWQPLNSSLSAATGIDWSYQVGTHRSELTNFHKHLPVPFTGCLIVSASRLCCPQDTIVSSTKRDCSLR